MSLQDALNGFHANLDADERFQPIQEQRRRHQALSASKPINAILAAYMTTPRPFKALTSPFPPPYSPKNGENSKKNADALLEKEPSEDGGVELRESAITVDSEMVWVVSPFPRRRPTLWLTAYDRPWDGDPSFGDDHTYVQPCPLPLRSTREVGDGISLDFLPHRAIPPRMSSAPQNNDCNASYTVDSFSRRQARRTFAILRRIPKESGGSSCAELRYVLGDNAVPFSGLTSTLKGAGFRCIAARKALLDTSWSLKWIKHPLPSDFQGVNAALFQKLNHFPGTSRLGRKDALHRALCAASERWRRFVEESKNLTISSTSHCLPSTESGCSAMLARCLPDDGDRDLAGNEESFGKELFPKAWLLPEERKACEAFLRDPQHRGKLFIVKPAAGACGRGVYLLKGGPEVEISPSHAAQALPEGDLARQDNPAKASFSNRRNVKLLGTLSFPDRFLVQEYLSDPYLVYGYKFDLRLYVVITSYEPARVYLYKEGLVRFATSPYFDSAASCESLASSSPTEGSVSPVFKGEDATPAITDIRRLTAHLTNFTINKKSEDFVIPCYSGEGSTKGAGTKAGVMVSKWSLAALRAYMEQDGVDWESTMKRVEDLLAKVFLSIAPDVRNELRELEQRGKSGGARGAKKAASINANAPGQGSGSFAESSSSFFSTIPPPPCTVKGISPFFEIYGVDVLLRRSSPQSTGSPGMTIPKAERPPRTAANVTGVVLNPAIIEVNIMPSLSTHYSPLDQCIKGNFIADTLNLVGLTPIARKPSFTTTPMSCSSRTVKEEPRGDPNPAALSSLSTTKEAEVSADHADFESFTGGNYGDYDLLERFLHGQPRTVVEACLVSEEERLRSPHFTRLLPTSSSFSRYKPLLVAPQDVTNKVQTEGQYGIDKFIASRDLTVNADDARGKDGCCCAAAHCRSLDEVLSAWEVCKERASKNDIKNQQI
ncbi:unnamed protein product [Phytomonas sp. EM1]|nr:unnamed protein product [Phytomonas sp. EM1]|eukprot:CCW59842.1 unnamed protein product [Phytomonas sp. isolate EM1]